MRTAMKISLALLLLTLIFPAAARAADPSKGEHVVRFVGTTKGSGWGMPAMILEVLMPPDSTQITRIAVPNQQPMGPYNPNHVVVDVLKGVQPGDLLTIRTETDMGTTGVQTIGKYQAKPGEDEPGSFIFQEADTESEHPTVTISRFGQDGKLGVALITDDSGKKVPDPAVLDAVKSFKHGEVVIAKVKPGQPPMLTSIEAYTTPLTGEFVKMTNTLIDKQSHPSIVIKTDSGDTTILLPGTTNKAGRFTVDRDLLIACRRLRAKNPVEYRTREDGDQTILKDINLAKTPPASPQ